MSIKVERTSSPSPSLGDSTASESDSERLITPSKSIVRKRAAPSPSPSPSSSSDDHDRSSDFEPAFVDDEQKEEYKPDLDELDEYGAPNKSSKRNAVVKRPKAETKPPIARVGAQGGVKGAGYSPEEDLALFYEIRPKISPSWAAVARKVGRDAKNRWVGLDKKVIRAFLGHGAISRSNAKGGYTAGEDLALFNEVRPKVSPNWASGANKVGRDAKNRWVALNKRIDSFIVGR